MKIKIISGKYENVEKMKKKIGEKMWIMIIPKNSLTIAAEPRRVIMSLVTVFDAMIKWNESQILVVGIGRVRRMNWIENERKEDNKIGIRVGKKLVGEAPLTASSAFWFSSRFLFVCFFIHKIILNLII